MGIRTDEAVGDIAQAMSYATSPSLMGSGMVMTNRVDRAAPDAEFGPQRPVRVHASKLEHN